MQASRLRRNITFILMEKLLNEQGHLLIALHPQPLLQCSKAAESQTESHSRSGASFIRLMFHLARAICPFLRHYVHIHHFLRSERRPVSVFDSLSTSPVGRHWLEETHPLPTQKRPG